MIKKLIKNFYNIIKTPIFFSLAFLSLLLLLIVILLKLPISDYCIEDGDCKEGRILIFNNKEVIINIDNCLKHNGEWIKTRDYNYCKLNTGTFTVKEIIYD